MQEIYRQHNTAHLERIEGKAHTHTQLPAIPRCTCTPPSSRRTARAPSTRPPRCSPPCSPRRSPLPSTHRTPPPTTHRSTCKPPSSRRTARAPSSRPPRCSPPRSPRRTPLPSTHRTPPPTTHRSTCKPPSSRRTYLFRTLDHSNIDMEWSSLSCTSMKRMNIFLSNDLKEEYPSNCSPPCRQLYISNWIDFSSMVKLQTNIYLQNIQRGKDMCHSHIVLEGCLHKS